jgi:hypothetical protein
MRNLNIDKPSDEFGQYLIYLKCECGHIRRCHPHTLAAFAGWDARVKSSSRKSLRAAVYKLRTESGGMRMLDEDAVLTAWYVGEVGGEALFSALAKWGAPEVARKWLALAEVEAAVASRLEAVLASRHLPIPRIDDAERRAQKRCEAVAGASWEHTMRWLLTLADNALTRMKVEAERLPAELATIGSLVVRHEIALVTFAELELAGNEVHALRSIETFLGELT